MLEGLGMSEMCVFVWWMKKHWNSDEKLYREDALRSAIWRSLAANSFF